jgi:hypothetical protein
MQVNRSAIARLRAHACAPVPFHLRRLTQKLREVDARAKAPGRSSRVALWHTPAIHDHRLALGHASGNPRDWLTTQTMTSPFLRRATRSSRTPFVLRSPFIPRARETHLWQWPACAVRRYIPARAWNSSPTRPRAPGTTVHPRACGELAVRCSEYLENWCSFPRVRGDRGEHARRIRGSLSC